MKTVLSVDLETYSDRDLTSVGVHKYVESDAFEIALFGYSIDFGPVTVIDCEDGERIPQEILEMLTDDSYLKTAWNAPFEMACLGKLLGTPMIPEQWSDTAVVAASVGLPLKLASCCEAMHLPPDLAKKDGAALIRYFAMPCAPTLANRGRTRNMPWDDYEKWERYKSYNKRDVEVENTIRRRLLRYLPDETEQRFWCLDHKINNRGVRLDLQLARNAIDMNARYVSELSEEAEQISGLSNLKSTQAVKEWLERTEGIEVASLNKKAMPELLEAIESEDTKRFLELRKEITKTSTAKFDKMLECACKDDHARGLFQFYGASRTGRFCLTGDHEVLTPSGWVRLDQWGGGKIACWTRENELVSFQGAKAVQFDYAGPMYSYESQRISQCSTPDHKMISRNPHNGQWEIDTVENFSKRRPCIPFWGRQKTYSNSENADQLRVLVMTQADGHFTPDGDIKYGFKKTRKAERCKCLLRKVGLPFTYQEYEDGRRQISVASRFVPLWLRQFKDKTFGDWLFDEDPQVFFDELELWDGYRCGPQSIQYSTTNKKNADIVQAFAHISGRSAQMRVKHRDKTKTPNWHDAYILDIWLTPGLTHEIRRKPEVLDYNGKVYCAVTETGFFLVRRNGKVWVTGNSGRLLQLQNLPQNHIEDLEDTRALVRAGSYEELKEKHPNISSTLSELIRTAIIPEPGCQFLVADFSAIEARVIAWFAKEEWRLDVFRNGGDIYCTSASHIFGVPVEKNGVNGHLRQRGKVAELACIAEGQLVLTDRGLVPIEDVTTDMLVWDGIEWVQHNGVVRKGVQRVITYEGLAATPDHRVWVEGKSEPIPLRDAARSGAHLVQTGNGRAAIRLGHDYLPRKAVDKGLAQTVCPDQMFTLQGDPMDALRQFTKGSEQRVPDVLATEEDPEVAGQKTDRTKAEMREPERQGLQKLRGSGDNIRLPLCNGGGSLDNGEPRSPGRSESSGAGSGGQRPWICTWKSAMGDEKAEQRKPTMQQNIVLETGGLAVFKDGCVEETQRGAYPGADIGRRLDGGRGEAEKLEIHSVMVPVYDVLDAGPRHRFTVSNALVHNCGYGGGLAAMRSMDSARKLANVPDEEVKQIVTDWRNASPNIVAWWYSMENAAKRSIKTRASAVDEKGGILFEYERGNLFMTLPSSRRIAYVNAAIGTNRFGNESVVYAGQNQVTRKWETLETYGGKLVENAVQATARDCLRDCMLRMDKLGFDIRMHVHDEVIVNEPIGGRTLDDLINVMREPPVWAPDLPLNAAGFAADFYQKD